MPAPPQRLPKYWHDKPKDLAVVRIDGRDVYLGKYDSPESREKYNRAVAAWLTTGAEPEPAWSMTPDLGSPSVSEVVLAFFKAHDKHYRHADRDTDR
jgi:hypothetical protein